MRRLSGEDSGLLSMELPSQPMSIMVLDHGAGRAATGDGIGSNIVTFMGGGEERGTVD